MTLKEFLIQNDLYEYVEHIKGLVKVANRIKLNEYEELELDDGFKLYTDKEVYKVIIKKVNNEYTYYAEARNRFGFFNEIPCVTRSQENKYPKLCSWIGTALVEKFNN